VIKIRALEKFHAMLGEDTDRVSYGYKEVVFSDQLHAVQDLLVTDHLFQSADFAVRAKYVALVESVKSHGGEV
jgi:protein pelota